MVVLNFFKQNSVLIFNTLKAGFYNQAFLNLTLIATEKILIRLGQKI